MNRKGSSIIDLLFVVFFVLALAITGFATFKMQSDFTTALGELEGLETADALQYSQDYNPKLAKFLDFMFLFAFAGLALAIILSGFVLDTNPFFFILYIVLMISVVILAAVTGNAYEQVEAEFSGVSGSFVFIPFLMDNLVTIMVVVGMLLAIGLYSKSQRGDFVA